MDLNISGKHFIVTGASAGLGRAVLESLLKEGARVLAVARTTEKLSGLEVVYGDHLQTIAADLTHSGSLQKIVKAVGETSISGLFVNAGGPPAKSIDETSMEDWDDAYQLLIRWKVALVKHFLPKMVEQRYGRILFSESSSIKQPVENLVLSNSLRLAIAGFSKTISVECAKFGVTSNVIGPGYHKTQAVERLFTKKSQVDGVSVEEAQTRVLSHIPVGTMGDPADFSSLAVWLLSPLSKFATGQLYLLDGGAIQGTM